MSGWLSGEITIRDEESELAKAERRSARTSGRPDDLTKNADAVRARPEQKGQCKRKNAEADERDGRTGLAGPGAQRGMRRLAGMIRMMVGSRGRAYLAEHASCAGDRQAEIAHRQE